MWKLGVVIAVAAAACGKKGPPLAPLVHIPAAVEQLAAQRVGSDVYVTLTIPSANIDEYTPADLSYVEVYGYTGRAAPPRARFAELGSLVATIPVTPPAATAGETPAPPGKPVRGAEQGSQVTVRDTLSADELVQGRVAQPIAGRAAQPPSTRPAGPTSARTPDAANQGISEPTAIARADEPTVLHRYYMAYPWSPRRRVGPPSATTELPLLPLPDPPPSVELAYSEQQITLTWEPSGGLIGFLLERALPEEPLPFEIEPPREPERAPVDVAPPPFPAETSAPPPSPPPAAAGPIGYNVYRYTIEPFAPPPENAVDEIWSASPPVPLNPAPVGDLEFLDTVRFGEERCYSVRAVRGVGPGAPVGNASRPACVTPVDTFPPAAPTGLATVASAGAIHLIWEPNPEADLGGYVVLRGDAADDTLRPLTPTPIAEASYHDTAVTPGLRYVYAVVAVDNRFPVPNTSAMSAVAEETAR